MPPQVTCASALPGKTVKHENRIFHSNAVLVHCLNSTRCLNSSIYRGHKPYILVYTWHTNHVHVRYMLSSVRLSSVCRLSVCNVRAPYSAGSNFPKIFYAFGTLAIQWHPLKILRRSSQGNPSVRELNTRGVAKYSDFGPIEGYVSETVQDRR